MDDFLGTAKQVTSASHHPCQAPKPIDPRTLEVALFPPINQWGYFAVQIRPLTPHAISRLARQAETGLTAHKMLPSKSSPPPSTAKTSPLSGQPSSRQPILPRGRCGTGPPPTSVRRPRSPASRR
jgi:hypothetical protein